MKRALITGIFGQDGSYLCEILIEKGYEVYGIVGKDSSKNSEQIKLYLVNKLVKPCICLCNIHQYDEVLEAIRNIKPDEIYHLAAKHYSSEMSSYANDRLLYLDNITATFNILSALKECKYNSKVILAGSCLMFDGSDTCLQDEKTPFQSESFYGLAKITEQKLAEFFRNMGVFVSMAILYNHESPRRSDNFVTKKIVKNLVQICNGKQNEFSLGCIDAIKDWGYAKDYSYGMWLMAQEDIPSDYVLSTGTKRTIKDFIEVASSELGIDNWTNYIKINNKLIRRNNTTHLVGNPSLAKENLGWNHTINFEELVKLIVKSELSETLD
jgi:GDPmannose 4,6-dehydratase